jgi:hypothetical protein
MGVCGLDGWGLGVGSWVWLAQVFSLDKWNGIDFILAMGYWFFFFFCGVLDNVRVRL